MFQQRFRECLKYTAGQKIAPKNVQEFVSLVEECKDDCKDGKTEGAPAKSVRWGKMTGL